MAGLTCIYCRTENEPGEQLCRNCFRKLPPQPAPFRPPTAEPALPATPATAEPALPPPATDEPVPPPAADPVPAAGAAPMVLPASTETPATCPHCGAEVPDPRNRVCVECHRALTPAGPLRLRFPGGEVRVGAEQAVPLGRDPARSPVATVFAGRDNISRLHATVGVDQEGAWVRDERSLNGTYVNEVPVPPDTRIALADGDTLRLAADVTATVQLAARETR